MISEKYLESAKIKAKQRTPTLYFEKKSEPVSIFSDPFGKTPLRNDWSKIFLVFSRRYKSVADSEVDEIYAVFHFELTEKV